MSTPLPVMHFKSPSLGSNPTILMKAYTGHTLPRSNTSTFNYSLGGLSMTNSPKASFREAMPGKSEKKPPLLSNVFPSSTKTPKAIPEKDGSPFRLIANDSFSTSGTLSPTTPHMGSHRIYMGARPRKVGGFEPRFGNNELQTNSSLNTKQNTNSKEGEIIRENLEELANGENSQLETIKDKELKIRHVKEETERELEKKELVVQIYEKLIKMCNDREKKKQRPTSSKPNSKRSNEPQDQAKAQGKTNLITEFGNLGGLKKANSSQRKNYSISTSSVYSMLTQKTLQPTTDKAAFIQRIDSKLNLGRDDYGNIKQENNSQLSTFSKQNRVMKSQKGHGSVSPQYRVKTFISAPRLKKSARGQEKSGVRSEPPNESTLQLVKKNSLGHRHGESVTFYTVEGASEEHLFSSNQTTTIQSRITKENPFANLADRLDNVFSRYQAENTRLIEKIQYLDQKIREIQASKKQDT